MTDYRKILMLRSKKCSQREMKRNKVASRETSKAVFCECYPNSWPQGLRTKSWTSARRETDVLL